MNTTERAGRDWSTLLVNLSIAVAMLTVAGGYALKLVADSDRDLDTPVSELASARFDSLASAGYRLGPVGAPAALVVFTDYQCPSCQKFEERLAEVRVLVEHPFTVVIRHAPLSRIHPQARGAAVAADCAGEVDRFEAMHNRLFEDGSSVKAEEWSRLGDHAGVRDSSRFARCVAAGAPSVLARDSIAAASIELRGTPTLVSRQLVVPGVPPVEELARMIRKSLESQ